MNGSYCNLCGHPCGPGTDSRWDHDCKRHTHDHRPQFSISERQRDERWPKARDNDGREE